jgi:hypothetical protein
VRNALGGRLVPVELHEADVVVSDAETFSALSAEERRERAAGRLCVVISDRLDVDLVLGAYFAGWLAWTRSSSSASSHPQWETPSHGTPYRCCWIEDEETFKRSPWRTVSGAFFVYWSNHGVNVWRSMSWPK